jgi:phosphoribosylamine--glycine ligase
VVARGAALESAVARAYQGVARIRFEGAHYRRDIGARALAASPRGAGAASLSS